MTDLMRVIAHARETALLESVAETLDWDERTNMPVAGGGYRAEQLTLLSALIHERKTDARYGEWLQQANEEISEDASDDDRAIVRVLLHEYQRRSRVPQALVKELTRNSIQGQQAWVQARKEQRFSILQPYLERTVELKREEAQALGYDDCPYDALLDQYEPFEKTTRVREVFSSLRNRLVALLESIEGSSKKPSAEVLHRGYPISEQRRVGLMAAEKIGFDFERGRLDVTNHPFCTSLGPNDVRLTTRYDESFFPSAFFGTLHEAGHGIYEQGLRADLFGLPPGKYASMAIHESQSRLWENLVGRSRSFWKHFFPVVQQAFPSATHDTDCEAFYRSINRVEPSLIRVEADEVTYNLHIIIRFELEQALISGDLAVADLPHAWNARYRDFLGIEPPHDGDGVLQDIHWGAGDLGYFPTYALGNLYAAQFFDQAEKDIGNLDEQFAAGDFAALKSWLNEKIHRRGQCATAAELVQSVTGEPLSEEPLMRRLTAKLHEIYC